MLALTYSLKLCLEISKVVAVGHAEELVGELVLLRYGARRVCRADGEHGRRAFSVLHAPAVVTHGHGTVTVSSCHGRLKRVYVWVYL